MTQVEYNEIETVRNRRYRRRRGRGFELPKSTITAPITNIILGDAHSTLGDKTVGENDIGENSTQRRKRSMNLKVTNQTELVHPRQRVTWFDTIAFMILGITLFLYAFFLSWNGLLIIAILAFTLILATTAVRYF